MPRTTGVVLTRSERIPPRPSGPAPIAVAVLVVVAHLGLLASAVLGLPVAFAVLAVACTALEPVAERVVPLLPWALSRSLLTLPWRWAVSVAALLCLMTVRSFTRACWRGPCSSPPWSSASRRPWWRASPRSSGTCARAPCSPATSP